MRAQAARALGAMRADDRATVARLAAGLSDPAWWVRANCAEALVAAGPDGRAALEAALASDDRFARERAREALELRARPRGGPRRVTRSAFEIFNAFMLGYFFLLNAVYTLLVVLGWRGISDYVKRRGMIDYATIAGSELTTPISIIVPAFNEEPVIVESVQAMLRGALPAARGRGGQRRLARRHAAGADRRLLAGGGGAGAARQPADVARAPGLRLRRRSPTCWSSTRRTAARRTPSTPASASRATRCSAPSTPTR